MPECSPQSPLFLPSPGLRHRSRPLTKRLIFGLLLALTICLPGKMAMAYEIYALGTSATNCKGVARDQAYTTRLEVYLRDRGYDSTVINGGVDGDSPQFMLARLKSAIGPATRIVIFEPGPNPSYKQRYLDAVEEILTYLKAIDMPAIYASSPAFQSEEEAGALAKKYGAFYYGEFGKGVPHENQYWQFDFGRAGGGHGWGGHMSGLGCDIVAKQMSDLVAEVISLRHIRD